MENQHDTPDEPRGAGGPESPAHVAKDEGASDSQERDHELFAHEPELHESEPHESEIVAPEAGGESQRRSRRSRRPFENRAAIGKNSPCCWPFSVCSR